MMHVKRSRNCPSTTP